MKIVIAGGTGQVGAVLRRGLAAHGHELVVLSRAGSEREGHVAWDGRTLGPWAAELDGADVVINLAGRSVNCRYTEPNLREMRASRVDSTRVIGEAIARAARPPRVWLQMSTATIYAHSEGAPNDEHTGVMGGSEPDAPAYWARSVEIAKAWEAALAEADTPYTRKLALRTAMVMSPDRGGIFDVLLGLVRAGLGGAVAGGAQYVSWIHERDFVRAVVHLIERADLEGPVNLAAPNPLPQRDFMAAIRRAYGRGVGLPAAAWMAEIGAFFLRTDTELLLKSRRVVPGRLLESGFRFEQGRWPEAARDLVARWREVRAPRRVAVEPVEVESAETKRSAAIKGAVVALAAHVVLCLLIWSRAQRPNASRLEDDLLAVFAIAGLPPTLFAGTVLGDLAWHLRRVRWIRLLLASLPVPVIVSFVAFGLVGLMSPVAMLFGVRFGGVHAPYHVPITLVSSLVLSLWVRPAPAEPEAGASADGDGSTLRAPA